MEVSLDKMKFSTENSRDNISLQTEFLTYYQKLKNEMESIPKEHKKFFRNALNRHTFDMEVYIPNLSEKNRKPHPNKNYLINKLIKYEKFVNSNRDSLEKNTKELTKFNKDYNYIKDNNAKQKDYITNLLKIYKGKGYEVNYLDYIKNDNIFNSSILLDHLLGDNPTKDILTYGKDDNNLKNFIDDNQLLIKFNDIIQESRSPNAKYKPKNKTKRFSVFNTHIDDLIKGTKNNRNISKEIKIKLKKKRKKKSKSKTKDKNNESFEKKVILKKEDENIKNDSNEGKDTKNNRKSKEEVDELNMSNKSSKMDNTITTYYGNESLIFNDSKNFEKDNKDKIPKINLKYKTIRNKINIENKPMINTSYNTNYNIINKKRNLYISDNSNLKKNKYLLTSLNKIKIKKDYKEPKVSISDDNTIFIFSNEKVLETKNRYKSKDNLNINLPGINNISTKKDKFSTNVNLGMVNKNDQMNKSYSKQLKKNNDIQKKIKYLKDTFRKKYSKSEMEKIKEKEINNLYSTINLNPKFIKEYPFDRVEKYFLKHKKMRLAKLNTNKGSNILPLLEGLENLVKEKDLFKIAKSLNETKKDIYLRSMGTLENFEKNHILDSDKIKEYDDKIPLLKYDYAEHILCDNKQFGKNIRK